MLVDGEPMDAKVDSDDENSLKGLLDAEVQITGAVSGQFDNKMQLLASSSMFSRWTG